jgi:hypothetical protein
MKKYLAFLSLLLFWIPSSRAQRVVELQYEADSQGGYQFYCTNHAFCNYILEVNFSSLDNGRADHPMPYRSEVKPGRNKLFKLSRISAGSPVQFKYLYKFNKGCINPKVNTDFTYLLPISPGKETQAYEMQNPDQQTPGDPTPKNWYLIRLRMKPGDTIYAARRGMVTELDDNSNLNDSGVASIGSENYLEIVHSDCSFGRYGILKRNSAFVKPGQFVEAGQPIALVGGDRFGRGSEARFSVYYNLEQNDSLDASGSGRKLYWVYVPLQFWTRRNGKGKLKHGADYTSEFPPAVLNQEIKKQDTKSKKTKPKAGS